MVGFAALFMSTAHSPQLPTAHGKRQTAACEHNTRNGVGFTVRQDGLGAELACFISTQEDHPKGVYLAYLKNRLARRSTKSKIDHIDLPG